MAQLQTFAGRNVELKADFAGPVAGQPILFLHGGGQTRQSWGKALVSAARRGYCAISLDLRGHGDSDWSPDGRYDLTLFADDLRAVLATFDVPPIVVGASLGGLVAMLAAAADPASIRALILVDITARIDTEGADEVIAFMSAGKDGFASVEEAADAVSAYLPHRPRPRSTAGLARNLRLRDGRYYWHWDPAFITMGATQEQRSDATSPIELAARQLSLPILLIHGGRSRIVTKESAREFLEMVPHADYVQIDGAHHMVAGDANDAFNGAIFDFVDRQGATPVPSPESTLR